ncbi:MAG: type II toxin-antitoxin system Phd/YefM family antitoxin [Candidatus Cryptobacteroides sp.]
MITTKISSFRQKIKAYVDLVISNNEPVLINRGEQGVVLVSLEEYNALAKTASILNSRIGAQVAKSIEKQEFVEVDIDSL